jgi:hypothetical protein
MRKATRCSLAAILLVLSTSASATPQWYRGGITRIAITVGNDFILTLDSGVLSACQYSYGYFLESVLGTSAVKNAYALALTAKASGMQFGTVIDKAINGPGGQCNQALNMFDAT